MVREVQVSAEGVHDLGYHVVWCPKYRRPVLTGTIGIRCPSLRSRLPTLWFRSFFVATVGAVSAARVQRYSDTQFERSWRKERAR